MNEQEPLRRVDGIKIPSETVIIKARKAPIYDYLAHSMRELNRAVHMAAKVVARGTLPMFAEELGSS